MYKLTDIKVIHLEVTSKCQASCPMCARNMQGGITNPFITETEVTLGLFKEWFSNDFIKQLDRLYMCGNLGDPIIAQDTLKIFEYIRELNPTADLGMNTNGSARKLEFWKGLANASVKVRFGIDGLVDTHSLYRINTDWDKIIDNVKHFIEQGGEATWDMLVFDHNKHQIELCKDLSDELGFKHFVSKNTARFRDNQLNVLDKKGSTTHILYPTLRSKQIVANDESKVINCKAVTEKSLYVSAAGNVSPCCWLDNEWMYPHNPSRVDYMDQLGMYPNLHTNTLDEIFKQEFFTKVKDTWSCSPLKECSKQCGEVDRFNEQFK